MRMAPLEFSRIAERLMRRPAAPYFEQGVGQAVDELAAELGVEQSFDAAGNRYWRLQTASELPPLALAAHLDHPGFKILDWPTPGKNARARFLGGVPERFFKPGTPLLAQPGNLPAVLGKPLPEKGCFEIMLAAASAAPFSQFAVWDLPDFQLLENRIHGRACDDLIGVAAIIGVFAELKRQKARANVIGVLSRAEEVGFHGALLAAKSGLIPKEALVISLETSKELPGAKMGQGMVIRVGDKASIFDHKASSFLAEVAADLQKTDPAFKFQRALMSGGTCEGTAYQEMGYRAAAVCVPLGNYHNCGENDRIEAEFVDLADACGMTDLLIAAAVAMPHYGTLTSRLSIRIENLLKEAEAAFAAA